MLTNFYFAVDMRNGIAPKEIVMTWVFKDRVQAGSLRGVVLRQSPNS